MAQTLDLNGIIHAQMNSTFRWYIVPQFIGFIVFLIAAFAETNRVPFDLPEAETELVAGFHTEYSAFRFSFYFLGEYIAMIVISLFASTLFLGGPAGPGWTSHWWLGIIYLFIKTIIFLFFYVWLRATLPRFRYDQLMGIAWKVLFPLVLLNLMVTAAIRLASDGKLF
jgi:NADH-quinone oxidoreductase subunit H